MHLGLYGAWDFAGDIEVGPVLSEEGEDSLASMGAPRRTRLRMSEQEQESPARCRFGTALAARPDRSSSRPPFTEDTVADLRGLDCL